jgi:CheY-like chemotaxis protein
MVALLLEFEGARLPGRDRRQCRAGAGNILEILKGDQPVDLLLSDVIMPGGMNGVQLTVEVRRIRPELKVLLASAYTAAALSLEHGLPDNLTRGAISQR